jgi:hypothetical protein
VTEPRRHRVFVDANELFPFAVMDVVLALAEDLVIDFIWSEELLNEWERVIVREGKRTAESARSVAQAIRSYFGSGRIDPATYRDQVTSTPGPDLTTASTPQRRSATTPPSCSPRTSGTSPLTTSTCTAYS